MQRQHQPAIAPASASRSHWKNHPQYPYVWPPPGATPADSSLTQLVWRTIAYLVGCVVDSAHLGLSLVGSHHTHIGYASWNHIHLESPFTEVAKQTIGGCPLVGSFAICSPCEDNTPRSLLDRTRNTGWIVPPERVIRRGAIHASPAGTQVGCGGGTTASLDAFVRLSWVCVPVVSQPTVEPPQVS